jgi:Bacterial Ig-like domain (group 3)
MPSRLLHRVAAAAAIFALTCTAAFAQNTIHVPADQPTIQAGINAANTGDTVLVAPGTYYENIDFMGKAITVTSSGGASTTTIDASLNGTVVFLGTTSTVPATLQGFTIQNGYPNGTGAAYNYGGGIDVVGNAIVRSNTVTNIHSCGIDVIQGPAQILSNHILHNVGTPTAGADCRYYGGGILVHPLESYGTSPPIVTVDSNLVESNADGGIAEYNSVQIIITRNIVSGAGFNVDFYGTATGISFNQPATNSIIADNVVFGNGGPGIVGDGSPDSLNPLNIYITNNTIYGNGTANTYSSQGTDLSLFYSGIYVSNNIIFGTSSTNSPIYCYPSDGIIFDSNDLFSPAVSSAGSGCNIVAGTNGNRTDDPHFVSQSTNNFHLSSNSPEIDVGDNFASGGLLPTDADGNARVQNATGKICAIVDIGAFEYPGAPNTCTTTETLQSSLNPSTFGQTVTFTAQLSSTNGVPTGTVQFSNGSTILGTELISGTGASTYTTSGLAIGSHTITATYQPTGTFAASTAALTQVVTGYATTTTINSSLNPSVINQSVTFTAILTSPSGTPTGSVQFSDGSTILGTQSLDTSGVATLTTSTLTTGSHTITATYVPTGTFAASSATLMQTVQSGYPTSITLAGSPNPSISSQSVTFTATVTSANGTPTGTVQFTDGPIVLGTSPLSASGVATFSTSTLSVGLHTIYATYVPTGSFAGSSTSISQTVNDVTDAINITSSLNPSTYGQPVTITAHVAPSNGIAVAGSVAFSEGGQSLGVQPVDASGNAAITLSTLTVGAHLITGAFTPNDSPHTFAGTLTQQVNGLPTSTLLTVAPSIGYTYITPITLTATVAPAASGGATPGGPVIFYLNGAQLATATLVNGVATYTGTLPPGVNQVYAAYIGDPTNVYNSSTSNTVPITITAAPSTLQFVDPVATEPALSTFPIGARLLITAEGPAPAGHPVTIIVTPITGLSPAITATSSTTAIGLVSLNISLLPGTYAVAATFAGTPDLQPSTATPFVVTVLPNPTITTLSASPNPGIQNNPVNFTATVSATAGNSAPTGIISILDTTAAGTSTLAALTTPVSTGTATTVTFTTSALAPGTHSLVAVFAPSAAFVASQSAPLSLVIEPQSFTLTLSDPTLTIQTGHHKTETVSLTSIGGLTATFSHSCGALPVYVSCLWAQASVTLPANGTVSTSLDIDTDQLPGFLSSNTRPTQNPGAPFMARTMRLEWAAKTLAFLLPLSLLGIKRRRKLSSLLSLLLLAALATTLTACGADKYPASTPPGTYIIPITASAISGGTTYSQTVNLTLIVTP